MSACQHCGRSHLEQTPVCPISQEAMSSAGIIGQRIDRYQISRLLGMGGFGAVYQATHVHTDAQVALKLLKKQFSTDASMVERFLREAKAAAALGNEHIIRILDAGITTDNQAFLALEFLDGMDLQEVAKREGPLNVSRVISLTIQVLDGLSAAHAKNIVHRDMKPANVFVQRNVSAQGIETEWVKILDFGISKMRTDADQRGLTMTGMAMGTPSYMAPEQFFDARNVDARADIYSVCAMLYELLANRLPIEATSYADLIVKVKSEIPPPLQKVAAHVPQALAQVVSIGLSKDPKDRWQSAQDLSKALQTAVPKEPKPMPNVSPADPVRLDATYTPPPKAAAIDVPKLKMPQQTPLPVPQISNQIRPMISKSASQSSSNTVVIIIVVVAVLSLGCCVLSALVAYGLEQQEKPQIEENVSGTLEQ